MVGSFTVVDGWMRFERLDQSQPGIPTHVLAWRFTDTGSDAWTGRLNRFKSEDGVAIAGAARVLTAALPALLNRHGWTAASTGIVAALSSGDTQTVPTKPLPRVVRAVATRLGMGWLPALLTKNAHGKLHNIPNATERDTEASKADYKCAQISGVRRLLVLDDFITRGTTLNNIATAVKKSNQNIAVYPIGLGKTEKKGYATSLGLEINNEHVPTSWAELWDRE